MINDIKTYNDGLIANIFLYEICKNNCKLDSKVLDYLNETIEKIHGCKLSQELKQEISNSTQMSIYKKNGTNNLINFAFNILIPSLNSKKSESFKSESFKSDSIKGEINQALVADIFLLEECHNKLESELNVLSSVIFMIHQYEPDLMTEDLETIMNSNEMSNYKIYVMDNKSNINK